jgi:RNA polymerase sigma-70 factor (ECF subfamily)
MSGYYKHTDNEYQLLTDTLNGNSEAFRPLVEKYWGLVFSVISRYIKDRETAADICQEAFFNAYNKLDQFKLGSSFSPWLVKIAVNKAIENLRREKRSPVVNFDPEIIENCNFCEDNLISDTGQLFDECIDKLPADMQILFILRHGIEFSYDDIAFVLDIPVGSVKGALFRLRNRLKEMINARLHREACLNCTKEQANEN